MLWFELCPGGVARVKNREGQNILKGAQPQKRALKRGAECSKRVAMCLKRGAEYSEMTIFISFPLIFLSFFLGLWGARIFIFSSPFATP